jgi:hypothetical protein
MSFIVVSFPGGQGRAESIASPNRIRVLAVPRPYQVRRRPSRHRATRTPTVPARVIHRVGLPPGARKRRGTRVAQGEPRPPGPRRGARTASSPTGRRRWQGPKVPDTRPGRATAPGCPGPGHPRRPAWRGLAKASARSAPGPPATSRGGPAPRVAGGGPHGRVGLPGGFLATGQQRAVQVLVRLPLPGLTPSC